VAEIPGESGYRDGQVSPHSAAPMPLCASSNPKPRVAALSYSLIESAKLAGAEPRAYLSEAARRALRNPGTVTLARDFK
jgi:hypothetical protein